MAQMKPLPMRQVQVSNPMAMSGMHLAETTDRHPLQPISHENPKKARPDFWDLAVRGVRVYSGIIGIVPGRMG